MINPALVLRPNSVHERMHVNQDGVNYKMAFPSGIKVQRNRTQSAKSVLREGKLKSSANYHGALEQKRRKTRAACILH